MNNQADIFEYGTTDCMKNITLDLYISISFLMSEPIPSIHGNLEHGAGNI